MAEEDLGNFSNFGDKIKRLLNDMLGTIMRVPKKAISNALFYGFLGLVIGFMIYKICFLISISSSLYLLQVFYFVFIGAVIGAMFGLFKGAKKGLKDVLISNKSLEAMINIIVTPAVDQAYKVKDKSGDLASHIKEQLPIWLNKVNADSRSPEESKTESGLRPDKKRNCVLTIPFRLSAIIGNMITGKMVGLYKFAASDIAAIDFRNSSREEITAGIIKVCTDKMNFLINEAIDQLFRQPMLLVYLLIFVLIVLPLIAIAMF